MDRVFVAKKCTAVVLSVLVISAFGFPPLAWSAVAPARGGGSYHLPAGPTTEPQPEILNLQNSFSRVAEIVKPAVVSISTTHVERVANEESQFYFGDPMEQFFDQFFGGGNGGEPSPYQGRGPRARPRQFKLEGVGSGVIIDPDGLVLTNEHVVRDADEIKVLIYDKEGVKKEYPAHVVGKDARTDIAVVRIRAGHKLPHAALGDSDKVKVGDWAIAIGSPFGLAQTFTVGVISAARQSLSIEDKEYRNLIQTDAAINRGNSGGPLLNIRGEIVGINTAIYAPTGVFAGIGFAVPINQAKSILEELVQKGHVVRGWLGVELQHELTPAIVNAFGLKDTKGALVNSVLPNSPAAKAGIARGDVIVSYNGGAVDSADSLQAKVSQTAPKKTVPIEVVRAKKTVKLQLTIGQRPESADTGGAEENSEPAPKAGKELQREWLGVHVARLTPELAENFRQPRDAQGVAVTEIDPGSQGEDLGLQPGDVIRSVNQIPTTDPRAFAGATGKAKLSDGVVLDVLRQGHPLYLSFTKPD
jgi:serine protease Do